MSGARFGVIASLDEWVEIGEESTDLSDKTTRL